MIFNWEIWPIFDKSNVDLKIFFIFSLTFCVSFSPSFCLRSKSLNIEGREISRRTIMTFFSYRIGLFPQKINHSHWQSLTWTKKNISFCFQEKIFFIIGVFQVQRPNLTRMKLKKTLHMFWNDSLVQQEERWSFQHVRLLFILFSIGVFMTALSEVCIENTMLIDSQLMNKQIQYWFS